MNYSQKQNDEWNFLIGAKFTSNTSFSHSLFCVRIEKSSNYSYNWKLLKSWMTNDDKDLKRWWKLEIKCSLSFGVKTKSIKTDHLVLIRLNCNIVYLRLLLWKSGRCTMYSVRSTVQQKTTILLREHARVNLKTFNKTKFTSVKLQIYLEKNRRKFQS